MTPQFNFSSQSELFSIAIAILEDYTITSWSFGGGTALSLLYYQHRMSYDIDIFLDDYSEIQRLIDNQDEIAQNLGIPSTQIASSPSAVTFILEEDGFGLKLDFVYSPVLTNKAFVTKEVFGYSDVNVQTALEIIAKKLKHREKATIRDFVDYAVAEEKEGILSKLKFENIVDIDRYFDVVEKFNQFDKHTFDTELQGLMPECKVRKENFSRIINSIMQPNKWIEVAVDHTGEAVAFDEFIEGYRSHYEELGTFEVYRIKNDGFSYLDVLKFTREELISLSRDC